FDLFKELANIATSIAGETEVLWWKEYTDNKVDYGKVFYNIKEIKKIMAQLPKDIREQIENSLSSRYRSDVILKDYEEKELMKELIKEGGREMGDEEIFWEYKVMISGNTLYLNLYPRGEWGIKTDSYSNRIVYKINGHEITIYKSTIEMKLKEAAKSFKGCIIYNEKIALTFEDNPNIHMHVKKAMLKLNELIDEERKKVEKIEKELKGIATPKKE
ncbi:MAG: hypothetical protein J7J97_00810, partial [Thermococcus sp.]|nr:hypothetical protein [Thermococcus sp.]